MNEHIAVLIYTAEPELRCENRVEIGDTRQDDTILLECQGRQGHPGSHRTTIGNAYITWEIT